MKKQRSLTRRTDRPTEPHSRIPDAIYFGLLPYLTAHEVKLWIALKSREWRKGGARKGSVRKSLNRIAKDIGMPRATAQRAMAGLRLKGLSEWNGWGIRVKELDFTTAFTTGVTTDTRPHLGQGWPLMGRSRPHMGQEGHLVPFPLNGLDHGRSVLTIRSASEASSPTVDAPDDNATRARRGKARASAPSSRALPAKTNSRKEGTTVNDEDRCSSTLASRPLTKAEAKAVLARIEELADAAALSRRTPKVERERREQERRDWLRKQAAELQGETEEETCDKNDE
jgi:hypothetical protein